ncbi:hypothetical protein VZT92_005863 [Zoarces viviparus]|uniref:Peptidoglycan binding-like domain-containing protein n=1 Tax=Zoarces viviparus TaxID=48416 RepID=A0AAW1FMI5_ZOAVI
MKMLWLSLLTLMTPSQTLVTALPLRSSGWPAGHHAGPSEADQEFAEVFISLDMVYRNIFSTSVSDRQRRTADTDVNADWTTGLCDEIQRMQRFFGLPPTGELTKKTLAVMKRPRCGLLDVEPFGETIRWKKSSLSYRVRQAKRVAELMGSHHEEDVACSRKQRATGISSNFASLSSKKPPPRTPDKCDPDLSFDAVTELQQEVLFFKDRFMWRKHPQFDETRITLISSLWPDSAPPNLDAVYQNVERNVNLFFKGHQYWVLRQLRLEEGFPGKISDFGFPPGIKSEDAALYFRNNRYTVFFTGNPCWRYNEQQMAMEGSATLIEQQWPGIPTPIDVFYEGLVHFFKGNIHYKFDPSSKHVVSTTPTNELLECKKSDDGILTERRS